MNWLEILFGGFPELVIIALTGFAMRMSYEKYCLRTRKPFRSWLPPFERFDK